MIISTKGLPLAGIPANEAAIQTENINWYVKTGNIQYLEEAAATAAGCCDAAAYNFTQIRTQEWHDLAMLEIRNAQEFAALVPDYTYTSPLIADALQKVNSVTLTPAPIPVASKPPAAASSVAEQQAAAAGGEFIP